MIVRFANVIYWLCTGLAVLWALILVSTALYYHWKYGFFAYGLQDDLGGLVVIVVPAIVVHLFGRTVRYILAGHF